MKSLFTRESESATKYDKTESIAEVGLTVNSTYGQHKLFCFHEKGIEE